MRFLPYTTVVSVFLLISLTSCTAEETLVTARTRKSRKLCPAVAKCLATLKAGKKCDTLPVPKRARFPIITSFKIKKLRPGVWSFQDLAYVSLILYRGSRLALVDFPEASNDMGLPFVTDAVLKILKGKKPKRIDMVYSHSHYDHIGGATRFHKWARMRYPGAKIRVWGTRDTRKMIKKSKTKRAILPDIIVRRDAVLAMGGGLDMKMSIIGGHTSKDLLLYIPKQGRKAGVVMLVDIVFPRWAPFFAVAVTDSVTRYLEVHKLALKLNFKFFVGGHFRVSSRSDVKESLRYGKDLLKAADEAFGLTEAETAETKLARIFNRSAVEYGNIWFGFTETFNVQIAKCVRTMIKKYGCRFGGVDMTIESHCFTAIEHRSLEG